MWKNHFPQNYIGIDIRPEVKPTILADTKKLPIKEKIIDFIYFDPPHHIPAKGFWGNKEYGVGLTAGEKYKLFIETNKEFFRVIKKIGLVIAKLTNMPKNRGFINQRMDEALEKEWNNFRLIKKCKRPSRGTSSNATLVWAVFAV
jgi:hypothetical protein